MILQSRKYFEKYYSIYPSTISTEKITVEYYTESGNSNFVNLDYVEDDEFLTLITSFKANERPLSMPKCNSRGICAKCKKKEHLAFNYPPKYEKNC